MTRHFCREIFFPSRVVIKMSIYLAYSICEEHYFFVPTREIKNRHFCSVYWSKWIFNVSQGRGRKSAADNSEITYSRTVEKDGKRYVTCVTIIMFEKKKGFPSDLALSLNISFFRKRPEHSNVSKDHDQTRNSPESGFIQKIATIFQGLFKDHIRFPRTTRNIISQIVQKCTFPAYSNKTLRLEPFASPTSLHFSVHWS